MCKIIEAYTEPSSRLNCNLTVICSAIPYALVPCVNLLKVKDTQSQVLVFILFLVVMYSNIFNISAILQAEGDSHNTAPSKSSRSKGKAGISGKVDSAENSYSFIFLCLKSPRSLPCKQILRRVSQFYEVFLLILAVIIVPCAKRNCSHRLLVFIRYLNQLFL